MTPHLSECNDSKCSSIWQSFILGTIKKSFVSKSGEFGVVVYYRSQGIEGLSFGIVKEFFGIADSPDYTSAESGVTVYFDIERHFLLNINLRIFP